MARPTKIQYITIAPIEDLGLLRPVKARLKVIGRSRAIIFRFAALQPYTPAVLYRSLRCIKPRDDTLALFHARLLAERRSALM